MTTRYLLLVSSMLVLSLSANLTAQTELAADKETCFGFAGSLGFTDDATLYGASGEVTVLGRLGLAGGIGYADMNGNSVTVSDIRVSGYPVKPTRGSGKIGLMAHVGLHSESVESESISFLDLGGGVYWDIKAGYRTYVYPQVGYSRYRHWNERGASLSLNVLDVALPIYFRRPKGGFVAAVGLSVSDVEGVGDSSTTFSFSLGYHFEGRLEE
jgi:hypothetical protein